LGALGSLQPTVKRSGYQGSIPKYDAVRNMVTAPPASVGGRPYRPGQGGINYGGDVSYVPRSSSTAPAGATSATGEAGSITPGGGTTTSGVSGGGSDNKMVAKDDLFYQSPEYQAYRKSQEGAMNTMDMYDSPYFGTIGSGSAGRALDEAYKKYRGETGPGISGYEHQPFTGTNRGSPQDLFKIIENAGQKPAKTGPGVDEGSLVDIPVGSDQPKGFGLPSGFNLGEIAKLMGQINTPYMPTIKADPDQYVTNYAQGGLTNLARGRYLQGGTDGMADKIPARIGKDQPAALSHGEFVIPADVVSHLGNGNSDAGAKKLYSMMDRIRQARTGTKKQGKKINPDKFMPGGLAQAYASGGSVKRFNTGGITGIGTASSAGVTGSETGPNTWAGEYMSNMLGKAEALSSAPYQQYGGPLTAGESGLQNKVFTGLQGVNFPGNLGSTFSSTGAPTIGANGQPVGGGTSPAAQYMNPYLQSVLDPQLAEMRRQNQITNMGTNAKLTSAGAFGGSRQAIMNAENNRNMMQEQNKAIGQGYSSAYDKAMQQFNTEQAQGMGLARLMSDQGAQQRGIEAEGIAADKKAFEEARENPYKMLQFQQSMLQGMPISATNIDKATPSALQQALSGAGGLAGLFPNKTDITLDDLSAALRKFGLDI
jgi:hypothetical protein